MDNKFYHFSDQKNGNLKSKSKQVYCSDTDEFEDTSDSILDNIIHAFVPSKSDNKLANKEFFTLEQRTFCLVKLMTKDCPYLNKETFCLVELMTKNFPALEQKAFCLVKLIFSHLNKELFAYSN